METVGASAFPANPSLTALDAGNSAPGGWYIQLLVVCPQAASRMATSPIFPRLFF